MKRNKTYSIKEKEIKKEWHLIDCKGQILGRVANQVARLLRGKNKATFTPHMDCGDNVVVINASAIKLSGKKAEQKIYFSHSDYPGGAKYFTFDQMMQKDPKKVIRQAVAGMIPKGRLGRQIVKNMKIFLNDKHTYKKELGG